MFVELSDLRWIKCWVKRTLKWRPVVFAVITSLFSAFDYVQFGHVELGTVVGSAFLSVLDLYFIGVLWLFGLIAMACAEALKRALRWCARNRTGLFAGFAFGLAFTVASGSLDLAACVCVAIYLFLAYFALGMYAGKPAKALKRSEVQPGLEEAQLAPPRRKRLVFNIANPEDAERLMQLFQPPVKPSNTSAFAVPTGPVSVGEDEAQQMLKLDSQTIGKLMLQDEQFAHKVAFLYAETRDCKLREAISMAKWKVHWWLRK
jgi:hypothetical protein